ncbi:MAG: hypothetical protein R3C40_06195 [Parvularculaceae bacterium]
MRIADPGAVGLPQSISASEYSTRIEREPLFVNILYLSLALIIAGVGYLKANISTIVGSLYNLKDPRRDSGFPTDSLRHQPGSFLSSPLRYLGIAYGRKYGFLGPRQYWECRWFAGVFVAKYQVEQTRRTQRSSSNQHLSDDVEWACYLNWSGRDRRRFGLVMNAELILYSCSR